MKETIILDVRTPEEYAQSRIKGSIDIPLSFIETREDRVAKLLKGKKVIIMCRTGRRAELAKSILEPHSEIDSLEIYPGGILAYEQEYPDQIEMGSNSKATLPILRQFQIILGSLLGIFSLLSIIVNVHYAYAILFMSLGLIVAGITGFCGMMLLIKKLPWNT